MSDEMLQDQAALFALGMLSGEEAIAFKAALAKDPELQAMVDEIAEAAASLTHALPAAKAPAEVLPRLLAQIRAERMHAPASRAADSGANAGWMPWALAASIGLAATVGFFSGAKITAVNSDAKIARLDLQLEEATKERQRLTSLATALKNERELLEKRVADLQRQDAISRVTIATLKVQATALAKAYAEVAAYVVWDASGQKGMMRFDKLPPAGAGKDYQMWVIDPRYDGPVSAGIFSAEEGAGFNVPFKPSRQIATAGKFAVSVEQKGGSASPLGPIVLMSN